MERNVNWFMNQGLLLKTPFIRRLASSLRDKARSNLITMDLLFDLYNNEGARRALNVPDEYDPGEWVVISGYYAMYMMSLAALSKIGFRSKNHTATAVALETFFVKKKLLEPEILKMLENARLEREQIEQLKLAKQRREIAQYSVTKETTRKIAENIRKDAFKFVERLEALIESLPSIP